VNLTRTILFSFSVNLMLNAPNVFALERLFTTPAERANLDSDRLRVEQVDSNKRVDTPQTLTVNGIVLPRNGKNQVWVNGTNPQVNSDPVGFTVHANKTRYNRVPLHLIGQSTNIVLRPGETYFVENGSKKDVYEWVQESEENEQIVEETNDAETGIAANLESNKVMEASPSP